MLRHLRLWHPLVILLSILALSVGLLRAAPTNAVVGSGTPASCDGNTLKTALAAGGLVTFDCGQSTAAPVTIHLTQRLDLTVDVVIDGGSKGAIVLDGGDPGVDERNGVGFFAVAAGVTAELRNLTLTNAGATAIVNHGALTLRRAEVVYARAAQCAGIQTDGSLFLLEKTIITSNVAETMGGGVCVLGGTATVDDSAVQFNSAERGGGLYVDGGSVDVINAYFSANASAGPGAAIFVAPGAIVAFRYSGAVQNVADPTSDTAQGGGIFNQGDLTVIAAVISENQAHDGGGIYNTGTLTVRQSDVQKNVADSATGSGGGLYNSGQATYTTSSLVNNSAANGGGFFSSGDLTVRSATVSDNSAVTGGALVSDGTTTIQYSTFVANTPEGLAAAGGATTLVGSIVAGCAASGGGTIASHGYNLDTGVTCAFAQTGDLSDTDPLLGPLEQTDPGRYTWHHFPQTGSPAIDAAEATCADANHEDQHNHSRPGGVACDIGAVEVGGALPTATPTAEPTATATPTDAPTSTATATPTPTATQLLDIVTETPTPEGPYTIPAPVQGAPEPSILVVPAHGAVGDNVSVSGEGLAANGFVQLVWLQNGVTFNGQRVAVEADNGYAVNVAVPAFAAPGATQICAAVGRDVRARLVCADFTVDGGPLASVQVNLPEALPASAQVRLLDHAGNTLYSMAGNNTSQINLTGINAGAYHLAITGGTANYEMAKAQIVPGVASQSNVQRMVDSLDPVNGAFCESDTASVALIQAKTSYAGYYSGATTPSGNPSARQGDMVMESSYVNKVFAITDKPQPEFGTFLSGVGLINEFRVQTSGFLGSIQRVEYWVRGAGQPTWTKMGEASASPYPINYNVGNLPPGRAEMYVAPVVNGERQCGRRAAINMIKDPMKASFIRQGLTLWSPMQQLYRMYGRMPQVAILPIVFPEDPWEVEPLGDIGTRLDAYVEMRGEMGLNQVMRLGMLMAETHVKVLGITPDSLNKSLNLLPGGATVVDVNDPASLAIGTGRLHLGKLFSVNFSSPKIVVFSYLGLVNAKVGFSFSMNGDLYFESIVYPLAPAVDLRLEPQASASFGVLVGADILGGLVEGSVEVGVAAALGLPLRIYAAAVPEIGFLNPRFCLSAYIQFHWSAVWGIFGGESDREPFFRIPSDCQIALARLGEDDALADRRVLAAPAIAGDEAGRMISVYIEDGAPLQATAAPQVMARTWDAGTQNWSAPVALTSMGDYVASPAVAMYGGDGRAVAAWVQSSQSEGDSNGGTFAAALAHMEIYAAYFDGTTWSAPERLTDDALPDGNPALAGDALGATLAWVHHTDGDLSTPGGTVIAVHHWDGATWSPVELLDGGDTTTGVNPVTAGVRTPAVNSQPSLARTVVGGQAEIALAWTHELNGVRRVVVAHNRAQAGAWFMLDTASLPGQSSAPAVTVPDGQHEEVEIAFTAAIPDPDGQHQSLGNMANIWTARLRDLGVGTAVVAAPVRDQAGETVRGEKPELQLTAQGERLLTFRHFGAAGTDSEWGQLAVTRAAGSAPFAAPLNLTQGQQHWQGAALVNQTTNQLTLLGVQVSQAQTPRWAERSVHANLTAAHLSASGDPLLALDYPAEADPAIEGGLAVSQLHLPAGSSVILTATLRNLGRDDASLQVRWWAGAPGTGTLLTTTGPTTLGFNQTRSFTHTLAASGNTQPISAEILAAGGNSNTGNDQATMDVGALPAPEITGVGPTKLYDNALLIAYAPPAAPGVAGYRLLRREEAGGTFGLVGETIGLQYYDALLTPDTRYCYAVQAYDAAGLLSAPSEELCNAPQQTLFTLYLPSAIKH